ncbi:MAG: alanine racemase [Spirochaetaceae bacterium]|jgi:predicted amino acid racemase|nr:alanine racemase [Spirochaetaceae bacterium]
MTRRSGHGTPYPNGIFEGIEVFLKFLRLHNPELIDFSVYLLKKGIIEPDTYILDLDGMEDNARRLGDIAISRDLRLYFMSKQIGRNPEASRRVLAAGGKAFCGMAAVDYREAETLHASGLPVKHIGHLLQVPHRGWDAALDMKPDVITLFSLEKARKLSEMAERRGFVQKILIKVWDKDDVFYPGQQGGFELCELEKAAAYMGKLRGVVIAGLTSFPCFLFDGSEKKALPTPNVRTLARGRKILKSLGIRGGYINMPSCNSLATLPAASNLGATHAEPGHSLTGTNPDNLFEKNPLKPSMLYITEVSHTFEGESFCFGGGYYRRAKLRCALIKSVENYEEVPVSAPDLESVDYHFRISGFFPAGTPVVMAFRTQIFVTRSRVALVEGSASSRPVLAGIWDSLGRQL